MVEELSFTFNPNPMQKQFIQSRAKADLFSSRMGEGKSAALCWSVFFHTRHNPGAKWVLIRDTWENIRKSTLEEFFKWFPPGVMGTWHATHKEFTWAEGIASGKVLFIGLDSPDDASKLMSLAIAGFGIDEPAPAVGSVGVDEMIFDVAMTRLRQEGMKWYGAKLAENNPDEAHWTYKRFVGSDEGPKDEGFVIWQPHTPENAINLPSDYYANLRKSLAHRPDLVRRFVEGDFGFQSVGKGVTPQWNDRIHLTQGLIPYHGKDLYALWDFGHNPTCIITQIDMHGHWNILDAVVGEGIGTYELITDIVKPLLKERYGVRYSLRNIGDPAGKQKDQSSIVNSPVRTIIKELGGGWRSGPVKPLDGIEPLRAVLTRTTAGRGVVQVDRFRAAPVWHALRGGWHFAVSRTGLVSGVPFKDVHSHPGDAMRYGAAVLWPLNRIGTQRTVKAPQDPVYFSNAFDIGPGPGLERPAHGSTMPKPE
jgi:hypothetical protein